MKNFFKIVFHPVVRNINRSFNNVKSFVRKHSASVRNAAEMVRDATRYFNDLPIVGEASRAIGTVASGIHRGIPLVNRGLDNLEKWQKISGLPTYNTPSPTPQVNPL